MRVDLFDFDLPPERIATHPASPRDAARLLHVGHTLVDRVVRDLPALLSPGDVLVFNDSRVIPARLFALLSDKPVELLLHQPIAGTMAWQAFARPAKKLKKGMVLHFAADFTATVLGRSEDGAQVLIEFPYDTPALFAKLRAHGHIPLPPYIARADAASDQQDYQTIYARADGSVAAPTAGLHFTPALMEALAARGIHTAFVTLHMGAGTFQPVKVEDTDEHVMHREPIEIGREVVMKQLGDVVVIFLLVKDREIFENRLEVHLEGEQLALQRKLQYGARCGERLVKGSQAIGQLNHFGVRVRRGVAEKLAGVAAAVREDPGELAQGLERVDRDGVGVDGGFCLRGVRGGRAHSNLVNQFHHEVGTSVWGRTSRAIATGRASLSVWSSQSFIRDTPSPSCL